MPSNLVLITASFLILAPAGLAMGQARSKEQSEPSGYREAITSALQEHELGNFQEARAQFTRAHALYLNARTLRGLGVVEFEARKYTEATKYLAQALAAKEKKLEGALRRETEALLRRAESYVGQLRVQVRPARATIMLDGATSVAPGVPTSLDVGEHVLEIREPGHLPERRTVTIRGGEILSMEVQLMAMQAQPAAAFAARAPEGPPRDASPKAQPTPLYKRWWLWTLVGVAAAGAAAGVIVALDSRKERVEYTPAATEYGVPGVQLQALWSQP